MIKDMVRVQVEYLASVGRAVWPQEEGVLRGEARVLGGDRGEAHHLRAQVVGRRHSLGHRPVRAQRGRVRRRRGHVARRGL